MPRLKRLVVPGLPHHVILRGNNRSDIFVRPDDFNFYLEKLEAACADYGCDVHAYVLMTNHLHLLVTPRQESSLAQTMQMVGRHYVPYFNRVADRTGALFESRYRSTIVDSEPYLLICMRYVELNPVRAGIVRHPRAYRWSSYATNAMGQPNPLVTQHTVFNRLGRTPNGRQSAYRALFRETVPDEVLDDLRQATNRGWVFGGKKFQSRMSRLSGRRTTPLPRGGDRRSRSFRQSH